MLDIDIEAFKKDGFSYEEIESIKRWIKDIEEWKVISEEEFYSNIEKKLYSKNKSYV